MAILCISDDYSLNPGSYTLRSFCSALTNSRPPIIGPTPHLNPDRRLPFLAVNGSREGGYVYRFKTDDSVEVAKVGNCMSVWINFMQLRPEWFQVAKVGVTRLNSISFLNFRLIGK